MSQAVIHIPTVYWIQFAWLDPIISLWTAYMDLSDPDLMLTALVPNTKRNPEHDALFHQHAGFMIGIAFLAAVLPRSTKDFKVLKIQQAAILLVDLVLLWSIWVTLDGQGRLSTSLWRPEDWASVIVTAWCAVSRALFVLGLGVKTASKRVKSL